MHSIKLHFKKHDELLPYQYQYSRCFRKMYANIDKINELKESLLKRCPLIDASVYGSLKIQVEMKYEQHLTAVNKKKELIEEYTKELGILDVRTKRFHNINKKRNYLIKTLNDNIVFGGKSNLIKVTHNKNMFNRTGLDSFNEEYQKHLKNYKEKRLLSYYMVGRASDTGNRKFNFDLVNKSITFKPSKNNHFNIKFTCGKNQYNTLVKLQKLIDANNISVTVSLSSDYVVLTYDNQKLNGFEFKKEEYKKAKQGIDDKETKKQIWINYKKEQEDRMLKGKVSDCFAGIDLNPSNIGLTIRNKNKILFTKCYDLSGLLKKIKDNKTEQIKYNLAHIYKDIFNHCIHFKVSNFVTEELNFKQSTDFNTKVNRQIKNLWCREF